MPSVTLPSFASIGLLVQRQCFLAAQAQASDAAGLGDLGPKAKVKLKRVTDEVKGKQLVPGGAASASASVPTLGAVPPRRPQRADGKRVPLRVVQDAGASGPRTHQAVWRSSSMALVVPGLYVGTEAVSTDYKQLQEAGITHIVNACGSKNLFPDKISYLSVPLRDAPDQDLSKVIGPTVAWVEAALTTRGGHLGASQAAGEAEPLMPQMRSPNKVLIHCQMGISRSVALLIAYLISKRSMTFEQALACVKRVRPIANPNVGFVAQLKAFSSS